MQPKYKTERQLKMKLEEMAIINKRMIDVLSFNLQDLQKASETGMTPEQVAKLIERTIGYVQSPS